MNKEHPILFSTDMVKAILDGRKTMTRRIIKPQPKIVHALYPDASIETEQLFRHGDGRIHCPYGQVGDILWCRETLRKSNVGTPTRYAVDDCPVFQNGVTPSTYPFKKSPLPSIFMPRWASRITLEIINIRVERLQDINAAEAAKEGVAVIRCGEIGTGLLVMSKFIDLWDSINSKRGYSWESNPWVWVIEFLKENIK